VSPKRFTVQRVIARYVLGALLAVASCFAQLDNASIQGTVVDPSGAVVPGADVTVQNQGTSITSNLTTDGSGTFIAPVLQVGVYRVTVTATGFKTYSRPNIELRVADRVRLNIELQTGDVTETITVTGEAPLVEAASTTLGGTINTQQVTELPLNGRSMSGLLSLSPGVNMLGTSRQRNMSGTSFGRLFETGTRLLVDGGDSGQVDSDLPDSAYASQARITRASVDAIGEIRIQQSMFSAEYGQGMGAVVNFITKSGTNEFHGGLFEYFRNEKLDTRNYFNRGAKPAFRLNQFGGMFGGPIVRDKLFFYGNYEGVRQRLGITQNTFVPTQEFRSTLDPLLQAAISTLPLPNGPVSAAEPRLAGITRNISNELTENTGSVKVDYQMTSNDRLAARYNINQSFTKAWYGVSEGQFRPVPSRLQTAKLTYTKTLSATLLNEAGIALNRMHTDPRAGDENVRSMIQIAIPGSAFAGPTIFDLLVANQNHTFLDTLTWIKGGHQLKFGFQLVRNANRKAIEFQRFLNFNTLNGLAANQPFFAQTLGSPRLGLNNAHNNFFIQDDYQVNRKLTVNLGLRYQYDTPPRDDYNRIANFDPRTGDLQPVTEDYVKTQKTNFGPRVGIAYTPFLNGKTVLRMGYGLFYPSFNAAISQSSAIPAVNQSAIVINPGVGLPFPAPSPSTTGLALNALPINYKTPYTQQWNFNVQQGLGGNAMLQVGYIGNHAVHLSPWDYPNQIDPITKVRPFAPKFAEITRYWNGGHSNYHSLQTSLRRRFSQGLTFNVNYTWAHILDSGLEGSTQNSLDFRPEYGNADYDVRHVLQFDYTYEIPKIPGIPGVVGSGWQINGITVMRSGLPFTVTCGCDNVGVGRNSTRPNLVPGVDPIPASFDSPSNQLNIAAFVRPPAGQYGSLGRNTFHGPSALNWDFSLFKNFRVKETQNVQFRAEFFNAFNTPQFNNPGSSLSAPASFGRTLSTIGAVGGFGSNRQIQFALRYTF